MAAGSILTQDFWANAAIFQTCILGSPCKTVQVDQIYTMIRNRSIISGNRASQTTICGKKLMIYVKKVGKEVYGIRYDPEHWDW